MARKKLLHIKSSTVDNGAPKLPTANQIEYGEIAVNYGDGVETLSIKNSVNEIVTFTNDKTLIAYIDEQDNELATAAGLSTTAGTGPNTGVANFEYVADEDDYYLSAATSLFNADQILSQTVLENERVTAEALNDLNTRVKKVSGSVTTVKSSLDSLSQRTDAAIDGIYNTIKNLDAIDVDDTLNKTEDTEGGKKKYVLGVKIDDALDLTSKYPVSNSAISTVIKEDEEVIAAALNDLNTRVANTYTKPEIDAMVDDLEITIDNTLNSGSTNPLANSAITANFDRVEKVTAASLNDLNNKALELSADTTSLKATVSGIQDEIDSLSPEYVVNGKTGTTDNPIWLGASDIKLSGYTSPTNNTDEDPILSGDTVNQAFSKVISAITDNEEVTSAALNDLDTRITTVGGDLQTLIDNPVEPMVSVTYSELVALKNGGELAAGSWYRITDYQCTTTQTGTTSANHPFDIIVLALSNNTLSEEARAIQHEGDTYFANSKLSAWKVWYCLENDTTKFLWADTTNGKGVVYRLIDEFDNDIKYDFKNILFKRKLTDGAYNSGGTETLCYTLNVWHENACKDASVVGNTIVSDGIGIIGVYSNNFGHVNSYIASVPKTSLVYYLGDNVILSIGNKDEYFGIHNNMIGNDSFGNTFGDDCNGNTLGTYCSNNTFGDDCSNNTFGNGCYSNTFVGSCSNNTFGNYCSSNTFGTSCYSNTFGYMCAHNTFVGSCSNNTFGDDCSNNTFGDSCRRNTFRNICTYNTFGDSCSHNTFGNDCGSNRFGTGTTTINYVRYVRVEDGVKYANITTTATTSTSAYLQNITISQGVSGTGSSSRKTISHPTVGDTFQTIYRPANSQIVSV